MLNETIDPITLWNSKITRSNKVIPSEPPAHRGGPTNITAMTFDTSPINILTSPIIEHHVDMSQSESSNDSEDTLKDILADPKIAPGMMQFALNVVSSLLSPKREYSPLSKLVQGLTPDVCSISTS